jgi:hypothetical protein
MKIKILAFLSLQIFNLSNIISQVVFTEKPSNLQFVSRNLATNKGTIKISGQILNGKYNKIRVVTFQNKKTVADVSKTYNSNNSIIPFSHTDTLIAGKYYYDYDVYFYGTDTLKIRINNIVCGDLYIIQGQSNAVANSYSGLANTKYKDSFIRSFGTSTTSPSLCESDTNWYIADGDGYYNKGCIGQWGLVMAKYLLDSFNMPIAIFNGAVGGTSVSKHQKNKLIPQDLNTIYGRLLYRLKKAKMDNNVRGILYFQGESDGLNPILHDTLFRKLYRDWRTDFKRVNKYYFVQVRDGCGSPSLAFLEKQRQFEFTLANLKVISANGLNAHDGCHYGFKNGYEQLGYSIAPLIARDIYKSNLKTNIDPPNIKSVNYTNENNNQIVLAFMQPDDSIYVDNNFWQLFSIVGENGISITGGQKLKNKIILNLNNSTCKPLYLSYFGYRGKQPWVKNKLGAGLLSFDKVKVNNAQNFKSLNFSCPNADNIIGADSVNGVTYYWKNLSTNETYKTAKIKIKTLSDLIFEYSAKGFCKPDTSWVSIYLDKTAKPNLGNDTTLCPSQIINYSFTNKYSEVSWIDNNITYNGFNYSVSNNSTLIVKAKSNMGCLLMDTIKINYSNPNLIISAPSKICLNTETQISCNPIFKYYKWNNTNINSPTFTASHGINYLQVQDSFGCKKNDSVIIQTYPVTHYEKPSPTFCHKDSSLIYLPSKIIKWQTAGINLPTSYFYKEETNPNFIFTDSNNCNYNDTIKPIIYSLPIFTLGKDTGICDGNTLVKAVSSNGTYLWHTGNRSHEISQTIHKDTTWWVQITNPKGCRNRDTLKIKHHVFPVVNLGEDKSLHKDESLTLDAGSGASAYLWNNGLTTQTRSFKGKFFIFFLVPKRNKKAPPNKNFCFFEAARLGTTYLQKRKFHAFAGPQPHNRQAPMHIFPFWMFVGFSQI